VRSINSDLALRAQREPGTRLRPAFQALLAAGTFLAGARHVATAQQAATEFWPEINVYVKLARDVRTYTIVTPSSEIEDGRRGDIVDWQVGQFVEFGLRPLLPGRAALSRRDSSTLRYLRLRPGIEYQGLPGSKDEWRFVTELTPRHILPGAILLAWRNRGEARWIDGEFSWRFRSRAWFEREVRVGRSATLVPYVSAEPFYDSRYDRIVRVRCQFGAAIPVSPTFVPEVNFTWQPDDSGGEVLTTYALNIVAAFFF
jgi:hypothetical protein